MSENKVVEETKILVDELIDELAKQSVMGVTNLINYFDTNEESNKNVKNKCSTSDLSVGDITIPLIENSSNMNCLIGELDSSFKGYEDSGRSTISCIDNINQLSVIDCEPGFTVNKEDKFKNSMFWVNFFNNTTSKTIANDVEEPVCEDKLNVESIKKLSPQKGDILLFRIKDHEDGYYDKIREHMDNIGFRDVTVMLTSPFLDVSLLDEEEMRKHGWVKKQEMGRQWL